MIKKNIITEQHFPNNYIQMKTFCFEGERASRKSLLLKANKSRVESARTKTTTIPKNVEVVMKLSDMHHCSTQVFDFIKSGLSCSMNLSPPPTRKPKSAQQSSWKRSTGKMGECRRSTQAKIAFSPGKSNNYKFFPTRELRLKNTNPYKFYMFEKGNYESSRTTSTTHRDNHQINIDGICTFVREPMPLRKKVVATQYVLSRDKIQPWLSKDDPRDDSLIF